MFADLKTAVSASLMAVTTIAGAANKMASAIDNIASVAEEKSAVFADQARHERAMERQALAKKMAQQSAIDAAELAAAAAAA